MASDIDLFHELLFYTLAHPSPAFIHQHAVDAFAVQTADERTKPIAVVFGLLGLYLHLEFGFTGRQVQQAHMELARFRKPYKMPVLPSERGAITVADVMAAEAGAVRDARIDEWCTSVWEAFAICHAEIVDLVRRELHIGQ